MEHWAKLVSVVLTLVVAMLSIGFNNKAMIRTSDPADERESLTWFGKLALILILAGGLVSIALEADSIVKPKPKRDPAFESALRDLRREQARQKALNQELAAAVRALRVNVSGSRSTTRGSAIDEATP
jgi:hypothetical protein